MSRKIFALGTLHTRMFRDAEYNVRDFVDALLQFQPNYILTEARAHAASAAEASIDGGLEQALVYAVAEQLGAKVIPVDWFDDAYIEEASKKINEDVSSKLEEDLRPFSASYLSSVDQSSMIQLNGAATQDLTRKIYAMYEKYGITIYTKRNEEIVKNIDRAMSKIATGRVLVVFGLDHKYFLDDFLRKNYPNEAMFNFDEWYETEKFQKFKLTKETRAKAIANIKASKSLLRERLDNSYYSPLWVEKISKKYDMFDEFIALYQNFLESSGDIVKGAP